MNVDDIATETRHLLVEAMWERLAGEWVVTLVKEMIDKWSVTAA